MSARRTVLVIDDDLAVRLRIGDLLARAGDFVLHEAIDGATGLAAARELRPDLILLDIMMPGMTGYGVCTMLRADPHTRDIPIIVLSAAEESEAMIAALEAGADDFLRKPFSAPELRAKILTITQLNRFRLLAGERDRFRWLLDRSAEPIILADGQGALVYANARARELFFLAPESGGDVAAAIARHFRVDPPDTWAAWRELRLAPGAHFAIFQPETERLPAAWYDVEFHTVADGTGQLLLKFTDRSGAVRRELETFTFQHLISHKIRTPLNGLAPIFSFLGESREASFDSATTDLLRLAQESARRLEDTLVGILSYHAALFPAVARRGAGSRRPIVQVVALAAEAMRLSVGVTLDGRVADVAHAEILEVALTEIFHNYAKFGHARRDGVQARLTPASGHWELALFAPGAALPASLLTQLGRPYAQLEKNFSGEVPGMGLGLATVRVLLRSVGGDIVFSNHPEGTGLITTFHLPEAFFRAATDDARQYNRA